MNLAKSIEACAARWGSIWLFCRSCITLCISVKTENTQLFDLAEPIPRSFYGILFRVGCCQRYCAGHFSVRETRFPDCIITQRLFLNVTAALPGNTGRCIFLMTPPIMRNSSFTPGDIGFEPIQTSLGKLGVLVCWDQWYPEAARLMALKGAEILIYPTAIGWESSDTDDEKARQLNAWIISQRGHAVANGLPVVSVNRVGHEPDPSMQTNGILFWGNSFVAGPQGEFLAQAGNERPENIVVEVDLERSENVRRWWPFLRDRRIDAYAGLTKRFLD